MFLSLGLCSLQTALPVGRSAFQSICFILANYMSTIEGLHPLPTLLLLERSAPQSLFHTTKLHALDRRAAPTPNNVTSPKVRFPISCFILSNSLHPIGGMHLLQIAVNLVWSALSSFCCILPNNVPPMEGCTTRRACCIPRYQMAARVPLSCLR